jgi:L-threonylcarbamoyladenylate synthase
MQRCGDEMIYDVVVKRCVNQIQGCTSTCTTETDFFKDAKEIIKQGELVVYPTETLYALGANPFSEKAITKLFEVKKRPLTMPISVAVSDMEMMMGIAQVSELAHKIAKQFLPGPLTLLMKKKAQFPLILTSGSDMIGIRIPKHNAALKIIKITGPITATSANLHGQPDPMNVDNAINQLGEKVILYINCGECEYQNPSTIVDVSTSSAKIIRKGVIPDDRILSVAERD